QLRLTFADACSDHLTVAAGAKALRLVSKAAICEGGFLLAITISQWRRSCVSEGLALLPWFRERKFKQQVIVLKVGRDEVVRMLMISITKIYIKLHLSRANGTSMRAKA
ncbi:MAG: hypothetical protein AAGB22_06540, partial [Bacteroidota bacterium]